MRSHALSMLTLMARIFIDSTGTEWEVFDESEWNAGLALAFEHPVSAENPGLLFVSSVDLRRLWPRPAGWKESSDGQLEDLCGRAVSLQ
ncbi:MAG TPA: hypothetical protein VMM18_13065 [Gemmatimonadaceae bacterium]|nr:hypothetical protein [Gemmatimonadaceae bacterium]